VQTSAFAREIFDEVNDAPAKLRVCYLHEGLRERKSLGSGVKLEDLGGRGRVDRTLGCTTK